jgi:hypothetical protein
MRNYEDESLCVEVVEGLEKELTAIDFVKTQLSSMIARSLRG